MEAVDRAKEMSGTTWRPVMLEREDRRVTMRFDKGVLQEYRYEAHASRR